MSGRAKRRWAERLATVHELIELRCVVADHCRYLKVAIKSLELGEVPVAIAALDQATTLLLRASQTTMRDLAIRRRALERKGRR